MNRFFEMLNDLMNYSLFTIGESKLTVGFILTLIFSIVVLMIVSEWIRKLLVSRILRN